tara:strand:+ start:123 stop:464 length:342 start_codon:yes stop_codon:yes gene_type:complete
MENRKYNEKYVEGSLKGLDNSRDTIKMKGITSRILKQANKKDKEHNRLINALIKTKKYETIYNKWLDLVDELDNEDDEVFEESVINSFTDDELIILTKFNYCSPDELQDHIIV